MLWSKKYILRQNTTNSIGSAKSPATSTYTKSRADSSDSESATLGSASSHPLKLPCYDPSWSLEDGLQITEKKFQIQVCLEEG